MKPILLEFGAFKIYSYGAMLALGFLLASTLAMRTAKKESIPPEKILDFSLVLLIAGIIGARMLYVILNWPDFANAPVNIIFLNQGGLAIYGGFALGVPIGIWFVRKSGLPLYKTLDLMSPYVALAQSIGRIGCFLNGCCYGRPTDFFLSVYSPATDSRVHPTQLYSSLALLFIFAILRYFYEKRRFDGEIFFYYLLLYSSSRFFIEILRGDSAVSVLGFTLFQAISLLIFMSSLILYLR